MGVAAVLAVVGATATGKSALALQVAQRTGGEVINADALQVYRGLDIGTAKPSPAEQGLVRHHLIDVLEPEQPYSAGMFARLAGRAIADIHLRGALPIVVGGSGLYQRALFEGLAPIPQVPHEVRARLRHRLAREGLEVLYRELRAGDRNWAESIEASDSQRVVRGLEVLEATGRSLTDWLAAAPERGARMRVLRIGLTVPRPILYDRIEARVQRMVERGWVSEVRRLLAAAPSSDPPAFQAIGYRQLVRHLRGELDLPDALEEIVRATRRYAKRQDTWFRKEAEIAWFPGEDLERQLPDILSLLGCNGLLGGS